MISIWPEFVVKKGKTEKQREDKMCSYREHLISPLLSTKCAQSLWSHIEFIWAAHPNTCAPSPKIFWNKINSNQIKMFSILIHTCPLPASFLPMAASLLTLSRGKVGLDCMPLPVNSDKNLDTWPQKCWMERQSRVCLLLPSELFDSYYNSDLSHVKLMLASENSVT